MKSKLIIAVSCTLTLAACGGGSGGTSSTTSAPAVNQAATQYTPNQPKAGDTYSYSETATYNNGQVLTAPYSYQIATTLGTGGHYSNGYDANNVLTSAALIDVNGNELSTASGCTFSSPVNTFPFPWFVGQSYSQNVTQTCPISGQTGSQIVNIQSTVNVESYQSITVPAGTFNTLRVVHTNTYTNGTGTAQSINPYTQTKTCWDDVVTGFQVQCNGTNVFNPAVQSPTQVINSWTNQLISTSKAATNAFVLTGSDLGATIPFLYVTPNEISQFSSIGNRDFQFDTTQPVAWSVTLGGNTINISGTNNTLNYNGLTLTVSDTGTSFTATTNGATLSSPVSFTINATLISDSTKVAKVNITNNP